jgi:hypothetical protein
LLEEWCEYLESVEIEQDTPLGNILAEDEEGGVGKKWTPPPPVISSGVRASVCVGGVWVGMLFVCVCVDRFVCCCVCVCEHIDKVFFSLIMG